MLSKTLLVVGAIASGFVSAAPTFAARSPGSFWTIAEFTRTCNDTSNTCLYTYTISENDPNTTATKCNYTITGTPSLSARVTDYTALAGCASPAYSLNSGWDATGQFITLVVTNVTSQYRVFYGFGEAMLADGVVQASQTASSSSSGVAPAMGRRDITGAIGGHLGKRQAAGWTVEGFTWEADAPLSSTYHFTLNPNQFGYGKFECTIVDAPSDPKTNWDNQACLEDPLHIISWGYSPQGFAVMTVRDNTDTPGYYALFGYSGVSNWVGGAAAPDTGPLAVYQA